MNVTKVRGRNGFGPFFRDCWKVGPWFDINLTMILNVYIAFSGKKWDNY